MFSFWDLFMKLGDFVTVFSQTSPEVLLQSHCILQIPGRTISRDKKGKKENLPECT